MRILARVSKIKIWFKLRVNLNKRLKSKANNNSVGSKKERPAFEQRQAKTLQKGLTQDYEKVRQNNDYLIIRKAGKTCDFNRTKTNTSSDPLQRETINRKTKARNSTKTGLRSQEAYPIGNPLGYNYRVKTWCSGLFTKHTNTCQKSFLAVFVLKFVQ